MDIEKIERCTLFHQKDFIHMWNENQIIYNRLQSLKRGLVHMMHAL